MEQQGVFSKVKRSFKLRINIQYSLKQNFNQQIYTFTQCININAFAYMPQKDSKMHFI